MATLKDSVVLVIRVIHVGTAFREYDARRKHIPVVTENYVYNVIITYDIHTFIYKYTKDNYMIFLKKVFKYSVQ